MERKGGIITLQLDGEVQQAKGDFTYNLGHPKRDEIIGADSVHGYKETPQVAMIEGEITDRMNLDVASLVTGRNLTVSLKLAVGKIIILRDAVFAGEGMVNTGEGNIGVRWIGDGPAEEVPQ